MSQNTNGTITVAVNILAALGIILTVAVPIVGIAYWHGGEDGKLVTVQNNISDLKSEVSELRNEMNSKFTAVNDRLDRIHLRLPAKATFID